jgi:hypothetical protein
VALTKAPLQRPCLQSWIVQLHARVGYHKTLVAIANKHARMIWAILAQGEDYDPDARGGAGPERPRPLHPRCAA